MLSDNKALLTEGDVNFSPSRKQWYKILDDETIAMLHKDEEVFLHQSLSTPCLHVLESCDGIYITDISGKKYMDFHGNNVHQLGYNHPYIINAVKRQMEVLSFCPRRFTNKTVIAFSEKLVSLFPEKLNRVLFAPGGTSAVSMALKLAQVVTGKHQFVSLSDSFHGASLDAIAVGGEVQFKKYMNSLSPQAINIPQPLSYRNVSDEGSDVHYAETLETILKENQNIAAFIAETIRNTDVQVPSKAYWKKIREICSKYKVLLIVDEIPTAFGRTGKMFAFENYEIEPDIVCLGKGMGGGIIPFAGIVTKGEFNIARDVSLGHFTHEKSPLGAAAGSALIEFIEHHDILKQVNENAKWVHSELNRLKDLYKVIGDVRGIGLLWGIEFVHNKEFKEKNNDIAERVMYKCLQKGLSFKVSQGNVIQLSPPLLISKKQLQEALAILENAIIEALKRK
jgi:4-aminobutyrate aminotransferase